MTILLFGSEEHLDRWCAKQKLPRGEVLTLEQTWAAASDGRRNDRRLRLHRPH